MSQDWLQEDEQDGYGDEFSNTSSNGWGKDKKTYGPGSKSKSTAKHHYSKYDYHQDYSAGGGDYLAEALQNLDMTSSSSSYSSPQKNTKYKGKKTQKQYQDQNYSNSSEFGNESTSWKDFQDMLESSMQKSSSRKRGQKSGGHSYEDYNYNTGGGGGGGYDMDYHGSRKSNMSQNQDYQIMEKLNSYFSRKY